MSNQTDSTSGEINQQYLEVGSVQIDVGSMPSFRVDPMGDPGTERQKLTRIFASDDRPDAVRFFVGNQYMGICLLNSGVGQMFTAASYAAGYSGSFMLAGEPSLGVSDFSRLLGHNMPFLTYRCAVSEDDPYVTVAHYSPNDIPKCQFHPDIPMERVK